MEEAALDFMRYVPYTSENSKVYSPKLAGLLMQICGYIDSAFKIMGEFKVFKENQWFQRRIEEITLEKKKRGRKKYQRLSIGEWLEIFEEPYHLSVNDSSSLTAKLKWHGKQEMEPFKYPCSKGCRIPDWWHTYNKVKHEWSISTVKKADLECVSEALAGGKGTKRSGEAGVGPRGMPWGVLAHAGFFLETFYNFKTVTDSFFSPARN